MFIKLDESIFHSDSWMKFTTSSKKLGYTTHICGEFIVDKILGRKSNVVEITTNMPTDLLPLYFSFCDIEWNKVIAKVEEFTVIFRELEYAGLCGKITTNSLKCSVEDGFVYDDFGSLEYIEKKVVHSFCEDFAQNNPINILKCIFSASRLDFDMTPELKNEIKLHSPLLASVDKKMIGKELIKAASLDSRQFVVWLEFLKELGCVEHINKDLWELTKDKYKHNIESHPEGDVWAHTMKTVEKMNTTDAYLNIAALLHDIGKPKVFLFEKDERFEGGVKYSFLKHDEIGEEIARAFCVDFGIDVVQRSKITFAVRQHMRLHKICEMRESKASALMLSPNFDFLLAVSEADIKSRGVEEVVEKRLKELTDRIEYLKSVSYKHLVTQKKIEREKLDSLVEKISNEVEKYLEEENINNKEMFFKDLIGRVNKRLEDDK